MKKAHQIRLAKVSKSLEQFDTRHKGYFVCPTCVRAISVTSSVEISDGHIIPQAAGGRLSTPICKRCNNTFGKRQDKWFGEYHRLRAEKRSVLHTKHQAGEFHFDDVRVGGEFVPRPEGGIDFYVFRGSTSPKAMRNLVRKASKRDIGSVSFSVPLLAKGQLVPIGAMTAAYLLWFRAFGYSWALQRHLDPVRDYMRDPSAFPLPANYVGRSSRFFDEPFVGIGRVHGQLAIVGVIGDHVVLFPPADDSDFYANLPPKLESVTDLTALPFYSDHDFGAPIAVIFHHRLVIVPDVIRDGTVSAEFVYFPPDRGPSQVLSENDLRRRFSLHELQPGESW